MPPSEASFSEAAVIRSRRVVLPDGERPADVLIRNGTIERIAEYGALTTGDRPATDLGDTALLAGLVDTHVHVNEPGRTEWEGFATATRAAAAGGVTTIIDMPLNSIPPTTTVDGLEVKRKTAEGQAWVDLGFWGGAVPGNVPDLEPLHRAGVFGFKSFLAPSGVDEFPHVEQADLEAALAEQARIGALAIIHAEDPAVLAAAPQQPGVHYRDFLASRPAGAETAAVARLLDTARRTGARVHILHVSSAAGAAAAAPGPRGRRPGDRRDLPALPHAGRRGGAGRRHRVQVLSADPRRGQPRRALGRPGRRRVHRDRLRPLALHPGPQAAARVRRQRRLRGRLGRHRLLQLGLPAIWTEARRRGHTLSDVVRWMASGPASWSASPAPRAPSPSVTTPTWSPSTRTARSRCGPPSCTTAIPSPPTRAAR